MDAGGRETLDTDWDSDTGTTGGYAGKRMEVVTGQGTEEDTESRIEGIMD